MTADFATVPAFAPARPPFAESAAPSPIEILTPRGARQPLVLTSPHSGRHYPSEFLATIAVDIEALRRSEDRFVDELFAAGPDCGAPLLRALFPRSFCDVNREALELDPAMFDAALPAGANSVSPRVLAGLGVIPRRAADDREIYARRLAIGEIERRLQLCYRPYHAALADLIAQTRDRFGFCLLLDCHSMPSIGGAEDRDRGARRVDFVLGDCHGASCAETVTAHVETFLAGTGAIIRRNDPYAGGFVTQHYGRPREGVHALQIEINRRLYLDEDSLAKTDGFDRLKVCLGALVAGLGQAAAELIRP